MSAARNQNWKQSLQAYPPPSRPGMPVLLIQGWYYLIFGLWVAVGLATIQSHTFPEPGFSQFWMLRVIGVAVAIVGVFLIRASRRKSARSIFTALVIATPTLLAAGEIVAMLNSKLPPTFMIDSVMELGFLVWWVFAIMSSSHLFRIGGEEPSGMTGHV